MGCGSSKPDTVSNTVRCSVSPAYHCLPMRRDERRARLSTLLLWPCFNYLFKFFMSCLLLVTKQTNYSINTNNYRDRAQSQHLRSTMGLRDIHEQDAPVMARSPLVRPRVQPSFKKGDDVLLAVRTLLGPSKGIP